MQEPQGDAHPEREAAAPSPRRDTGTIVKVIVGLAVLILFIIFVARNSKPVAVDLVFVTASVRLIWVFVACALIGALVAFLIGMPGRRASRKYIRELERRVEERGRG